MRTLRRRRKRRRKSRTRSRTRRKKRRRRRRSRRKRGGAKKCCVYKDSKLAEELRVARAERTACQAKLQRKTRLSTPRGVLRRDLSPASKAAGSARPDLMAEIASGKAKASLKPKAKRKSRKPKPPTKPLGESGAMQRYQSLHPVDAKLAAVLASRRGRIGSNWN